MGAPGDDSLREKTQAVLDGLRSCCTPGQAVRIYPIARTDRGFVLRGSGITLAGSSADLMLEGCSDAAVFICTLGFGFESMLRTCQARSMADAFMLDACGSALVEELCDETEAKISSLVKGKYLTDRFSPGYGDLPLGVQADISRALNARKLLGVHLNESMLFYPSKTVSAVVGISDTPRPARIRGCDFCALNNRCELRKGGSRCGK